MTVKKWQKSNFSRNLNFLWTQLDGIVFWLFTRTTQNQSGSTRLQAIEQRQDQHKVRHAWSIGVLSFLFREIQMSTQVIWKYFIKKGQNQVYFPGVIFNFFKSLRVLPSTLCMTGELWPSRLIWHQDIRVTHCQSSDMSFIFTQYSFCYSFRQGLI